jgi:ribose transport system ATP-binding protein
MSAVSVEATQSPPPYIELRGGSKNFGAVQALTDVDFAIRPGEIVGLVGHNGAGKSTLINVLVGILSRSAGELSVEGSAVDRWDSAVSRSVGLRCVYQELSLCSTLTAAENLKITYRGLRGFGWRRRAAAILGETLDDIFPGHGIPLGVPVADLSIAQRQMVEIARAFSVSDRAPRCVILDEPTSSLGHETAEQLLRHVRTAATTRGIATILVTHRLNEILAVADRVVIMKDGRVVNEMANRNLSRTTIVEAMGNIEQHATRRAVGRDHGEPLFGFDGSGDGDLAVSVAPGEIVGFAGLDGHGQRDRLRAMFRAAQTRFRRAGEPEPAYVAGDRVTEGVFSLWSVADNLTIRSLPAHAKGGFLDLAAVAALARQWFERLGVRAPSPDTPLVALSGGNQQKVLFARALCSDARLIFLDDPMRGVDVGTKQEVYRLIHAEAEKGRSFVWYTTETEELDNCERIYVFREGRARTLLEGDAATQAGIMQASFGGAS